MTEVAKGSAIHMDMLDEDDVFLLDDGLEVWVWVGLGASLDERKRYNEVAVKYLKDSGKPDDTVIVKVMQGGEPS